MERGSWVASGRPGTIGHDVGVVLDVRGGTARVRWLRAGCTYVEDADDLRTTGRHFTVDVEHVAGTLIEHVSGYFSAELYRDGQLAALGMGVTREAAARDAAKQYRLKRSRRWARLA